MPATMLELVEAASEVEKLPDLLGLLYSDPTQAARAMRALRQEFETEPDLNAPFPVQVNHPSWWYDPAPNVIPVGKKATFTPEGRVYGRFFEWGECIASDSSECWVVQRDPTEYLNFHQTDVSVANDDGSLKTISAGGLVPGHSDPWADMESSIEHYNDPEKMVVYARAYDDDNGGYIVGGLVPGVTWRQALLVKAAPLSGHWEEVLNVETSSGKRLRKAWVCLGPSMVVRPGLPLHGGRHQLAMVTNSSSGLRKVAMVDTAGKVQADTAEPVQAMDLVDGELMLPEDELANDPAGESDDGESGDELASRVSALETQISGLEEKNAGLIQEVSNLAEDMAAMADRFWQSQDVEAPPLEVIDES